MSSGIATRTASILAGEQAQLADSYNRIVQAQAKAACCHSPVAVQITSRGKLETKNNNGSAGGSIKGMFVFGSSLVDNGNNNFLENSLARADYLPCGVDFPWGPSGRFTNGKNVIDLLGEKLKLPSLIPTFSDSSTKGTKIVHGVNFASAASGILDDTGSLAVSYSFILFIYLYYFFFILHSS
ncbi:hypothetical protein JRO89_XS11G0082800 [Xanthoceras sorbifolium]|uniref:GDSL esterase/lipase n=1 Tax=Xanthoceras sorbifolium TaxID=99658 RepID=A0ABQ8HF46_9ROSI|nr:hypothetical protein JRO89_XS11G0082800 [Xanthoceras sorbifolium]